MTTSEAWFFALGIVGVLASLLALAYTRYKLNLEQLKMVSLKCEMLDVKQYLTWRFPYSVDIINHILDVADGRKVRGQADHLRNSMMENYPVPESCRRGSMQQLREEEQIKALKDAGLAGRSLYCFGDLAVANGEFPFFLKRQGAEDDTCFAARIVQTRSILEQYEALNKERLNEFAQGQKAVKHHTQAMKKDKQQAAERELAKRRAKKYKRPSVKEDVR